MTTKLNLITGATGQLGSHIAEQLIAQGAPVRALVRPSTDASFLRSLGVEIAPGDLQDAAAVRAAVRDAAVVYHCAARVSDWGAWPIFRDEVQTGMRHLLDACQSAKLERFLHVSSISVYGNPPRERLITEEDPLGVKLRLWDYYPQAKLLAEELVRASTLPWTIVRPSWLYGERDRVTIPRVVPGLQAGKIPIVGSGDNLINIIYVGDVARGAILAAKHPGALGQTYNLCSQGEATQRQLLDTMCDALKIPRVTKRVPFFVVRQLAFCKEALGKLLGSQTPPTLTRRAVYLIGRPAQFSIAKAKRELGWQPEVKIDEGVRRTLAWYFAAPRP